MYNGQRSMISNAELERGVSQLAELDQKIADAGGLEVYQEIEALKLERLRATDQDEIEIIDEMIAELENPICNDNGVNDCICNPRPINRDEALLF